MFLIILVHGQKCIGLLVQLLTDVVELLAVINQLDARNFGQYPFQQNDMGMRVAGRGETEFQLGVFTGLVDDEIHGKTSF